MSAATLVVEIVLAGMLMLCAVLLPALGNQFVAYPAWKDTLPLAIAAGFVLGVIVDRSADSLLARWDGAARIGFAGEVRSRRSTLLLGEKASDPFPEDWMRLRVQQGGDGIQKWFEQLRVRVRVARSLIVLLPALATSLACWPHVRDPTAGSWMRWLGAVHLPALLVVVASTSFKRLEAPSTLRFGDRQPTWTDYRKWVLCSPGVFWLLVQLVFAGVAVGWLFAVGSSCSWSALACLLLGATLTALAVMTWLRVTTTYRRFLWNYCESTHASGLITALGRAPA